MQRVWKKDYFKSNDFFEAIKWKLLNQVCDVVSAHARFAHGVVEPVTTKIMSALCPPTCPP